jgi:ATP-dependent Clp protease ATP-binding subunit ClpA
MDDPQMVEESVRRAIQDYFKFKLSRPEILNRLGDNIIVFGFIAPAVARQIVDGMLHNIVQRVQHEHKLELVIPTPIREMLAAQCVRDLSNGGRGIGNRLEAAFVNPLSRALFSMSFEGRSQITVTQLLEDAEQVVSVILQ